MEAASSWEGEDGEGDGAARCRDFVEHGFEVVGEEDWQWGLGCWSAALKPPSRPELEKAA